MWVAYTPYPRSHAVRLDACRRYARSHDPAKALAPWCPARRSDGGQEPPCRTSARRCRVCLFAPRLGLGRHMDVPVHQCLRGRQSRYPSVLFYDSIFRGG
eukprot:scaffold207658_cov30-Tisochrysis_lutea.AAC.1